MPNINFAQYPFWASSKLIIVEVGPKDINIIIGLISILCWGKYEFYFLNKFLYFSLIKLITY